jgi:hypothetical protein
VEDDESEGSEDDRLQTKKVERTPRRRVRATARKPLADEEEEDESTTGASPEKGYRNRVFTRIHQQSSDPFDIASMANLSYVRRVRHKETKREVHNEINKDNAKQW